MSKVTWPFYLLTALSLSIGWGIRGNFGHEFGAMIPGALAAMAAVLLSGRADWHRRVAYFAFFGALGWSFGGSMSYMHVIAYTHSGHSASVLYGFACLFVIGFLWGALGGAGTALPAFLERERLTALFGPLTAVFAAWVVQDLALGLWLAGDPAFRHEDLLYWFDTDWVAAWLALCVGLVCVLIRRRFDEPSSLILHLALGWWAGFLVLVNLLGLRMTPPRGDNWAGCVGMTIGLWVWLQRRGLHGVTFASLVTGFIGGFGFATGQLLKLIGLTTGWQTNWHSLLEQSYGFINGLGVAVAMALLAARTAPVRDEPAQRRWTQVYAVGFVLVGITFLNLRKNPADWIKAKAFPEMLYGLSVSAWFHLAYLALAVAVVWLLARHLRRTLPVLPATWLGRGQLLYLVFLWWMVIGNFDRAQVAFAPVRLVTEGVIYLNAVLCTLLLFATTAPAHRPGGGPGQAPLANAFGAWTKRVVLIGLLFTVCSVLADWGITQAVYGDQPASNAGKHIRFGPNATATAKPELGQPHP
jgi:hypothetical protein